MAGYGLPSPIPKAKTNTKIHSTSQGKKRTQLLAAQNGIIIIIISHQQKKKRRHDMAGCL